MVLSENLPEDIIVSFLVAGSLVKNIATNLDVTFRKSAVAMQTPHWSFFIMPVFDINFAEVAQTIHRQTRRATTAL